MLDESRYRRVPDQFSIKDVGSKLLDHLAKGLYPADEVLREYIQNAVDAHRIWLHDYHTEPEGPIQVEVRGDRLSILDYGIGMNEEEVRKVKSIAVTGKIDTDIPLTGHKGVGIWAGLSYFERLILETSRRGSTSGYRLTIYFKRIVNSIDDRYDIGEVMENNYFIDEFDEDYDEHYTSITLENPTRSYDWFTDASKVMDAIRRICPCEINPNFVFSDKVMEWYEQHNLEMFPIVVEGLPVFRLYPSSVEHFKVKPITVNDVVVAQCWYAVNKQNGRLKSTNDELTAFRMIQKGFTLGGENPYSDSKLPGYKQLTLGSAHYLEWHVGEIHIISDNLLPNLQRNQLEESEEARLFIHKLRDFYLFIEDQGRSLAQKRNAEEKLAEDVKKTLNAYKEYEARINGVLNRAPVVELTQEEINILISIQNILISHDKFADSIVEGKKNPHLKDQNVKKLRKKSLERLAPFLINMRKSDSHDSHDSSQTTYTSSNDHANDKSTLLEKTEPTPPTKVVDGSTQPENAPATSFPSSVTIPTQDEILGSNDTEPIGVIETSFPSSVTTPIQDEILGSNDMEPIGVDKQEGFYSSSRKIPVVIVIGLLEEILNEVLGRDNDTNDVIMAKLKERIDVVLDNA
jgi:Histidine kinase-, DNA gyrase B-, and HSP90-like ATPase